MKSDIRPYDARAYREVLGKVKPSFFRFNDTPGSMRLGFIAQQLKSAVPCSVTEIDHKGLPDFHVVDTTAVVAFLFAAVQRMDAKLARMEETILKGGVEREVK